MTPSRTPSDEVKLCVDGQWFYRGNRSPSWFATFREGGGLADKVEPHIWPILEALAQAREEARRDKERLDFMDANPKAVTRAFGYLGSPDAWSYTVDGTAHTATTIRAAIDAARKEAK